ncbi:DUF1566 domain-containing protein [Vibrio alginolyticus]|uniref:Lcl domain-containing protein n=1 Tax=Vibrio alginolyticus TaxID=663 RepID=UPI0022AA4E87|nr:DUF1566 domain-containing protein [Vibrio alginolyticus]MCZ2803287.1 DUF1566 domain-containing protein [Vibrio alginolyticus]
MNKYFKSLFAIVIFPLLMLLTGCNSEGAFSESTVKLERIDITASLITTRGVGGVTLAIGNKQPFEAVGHYSDGSSRTLTDLTVSDWHTSNSDAGRFDVPGVFTATNVGNTTLTATKDGVTSNTVDVNVCGDLSGACIDIFDTGTGKLFTNSPSVAYLDSIGGSATDGIYAENGTDGPSGNFYRFNWTNANALCTTYNTLSLGGRTNWRLATRGELKVELYDASGNMFTARGWPTNDYYWSATPDGSVYYLVSLDFGDVSSYVPSSTVYASCVSNP